MASFRSASARLRNQPARRKRDVALADAEPILFPGQQDKIDRGLKIVERLARPHHHNAVDALAAVAPRRGGLHQDFARAQVAHKAVQPRGAEGAAHLAADLRRHAEGISVLIFHQHALDAVSVSEAKEVFHRSVERRFLAADDFNRRQRIRFREPRALRLRQLGKVVKALPFIAVQAQKDLLRPETRQPHAGQRLFQLGGKQGENIRFLLRRQRRQHRLVLGFSGADKRRKIIKISVEKPRLAPASSPAAESAYAKKRGVAAGSGLLKRRRAAKSAPPGGRCPASKQNRRPLPFLSDVKIPFFSGLLIQSAHPSERRGH